MKRFEISYNPYSNRIHFRVAEPAEESEGFVWIELPPESSFMEYQNEKCIFENCVERILGLVNNYINTTDSLEISFLGTVEDFNVLQNVVLECDDSKAQRITCVHKETYISSNSALENIKKSFSKIKKEFDDYIDSEDPAKRIIGDAVMKYKDTVKPEIPICVIGNYSVGKSALINAFIGREVLPSKSNSTTAINVIVRNDKKYKVCFEYQETRYEVVLKGKKYVVNTPKENDKDLLSCLFSGCETCANEQEIIHMVLGKLNSETKTDGPVSHIDNCVEICVPFLNTSLNFNDYSFCFIDTPGSNNGDEKSHRANLEDLMLDQTNALPIVVATRNALTSNDSFDLRNLLNEMEDGFSKQNCIIVISMSDELVSSQIKEEIPDSVREGINDPTIMYVSPVAAIGAKKDDSTNWIDEAYKEIYELKSQALLKTMPPDHNMTPCGRKLSSAERSSMEDLLYASGLPSLEQEINYFAMRFAEYKKCTKGRQLLLDAMDMANDKLEESKDQLESDKAEKIKEQQAFRSELLAKINQIKEPPVNVAINQVRGEFNATLADYCKGVHQTVASIWKRVSNESDSINLLNKAMQEHCQTNLYTPNSDNIRVALQSVLSEQASEYMSKVRACVTDEYCKLSEDAQKELNELFRNHSDSPQLEDVEIGMFQRIKLGFLKVLGKIGKIFSADDRIIAEYSRNFIYQLAGDEYYIGLFAKQCIKEPAQEYTKQIRNWSNQQKDDIQKTLNQDNAILSSLDSKINDLEYEIADLEKRLSKLSSVRSTLVDLLPEDD